MTDRRRDIARSPVGPPFNTAMFNLKKLLLCALLVFFVFPHTTYEFLQFNGAAKGGVGVGHVADAIKPIATKRPFEKKFKFHKIERVYIGDEEEKNDDDDDDSENDGDDKNDDDHNGDRKPDDDASRQMDEEAAESEELPFKRARVAHKERRATTTSTPMNEKKRSTTKKQNKIADDESNQSEESKTFFGSLFGNLFGGGSGDRGDADPQPRSTSEEDSSAEKKVPSNGIIDWLKWLSERNERTERQEAVEPDDTESWHSYLNRWPFNSFFPISKSAKPIRRQPKEPASPQNGNSDEATTTMSQENFESILHTLPSFVLNPDHVTNTECRQQLQIFHRQLRGNKFWTLQMLDATGKISAGLLRGNINQFGDFDQCMQVKARVKVTPEIPVRIRGKYCLAHIEMQTSTKELRAPLHYAQGRALWRSHFGNPSHFAPRYDIANWGVCIPNLCSSEVVQQMVESNLRAYNATGIEFHVEVGDNDCYTRSNVKLMKLIKKDRNFALTIFGIGGLVVLCVGSLLNKYQSKIKVWVLSKFKKTKTDSNGESEGNESTVEAITDSTEIENAAEDGIARETTLETDILQSLTAVLRDTVSTFSPQRTVSVLLGSDSSETQFPIFNVLKLGATFALYVSLKYIMIGHLPIINRDIMVRALEKPQSILFRTPMVYMDMLLMVSGFLIAYQLAEEMEQKSHIQLLKRMALKITRYLPTLYAVLLFQTYILPLLGAGPLWTNLIGQNTRLCEQQLWRNFFSVQNAIEFEETCSPMSIQLALEVQLYILGPLIVWLYYTDADAAFFIYGALHAMSVAARYSRTQREYLSTTLFHGMNVSKFYRTANLLISSPISRATPYLFGIGTGLLHRSQAGVLEIASELIPVGWLCASLGLFWCFWSPSASMRTDFVYTAGDAASYAAWCPLILSLSVAWCIFMFPRGENSVLHLLTTMRPVLFLSRITFPIQLMTYVVVLYNTAGVSEPHKYHLGDLVNFNEIAVILISGLALAFLIDVPAQHIRKVVINRIFVERTAREYEQEAAPGTGAEASEPEAEADNEEQIDQAKDDVGDDDPEVSTEELEKNNKVEVTDEEENKNEDEEEEEEEEENTADKESELSENDEIKKRPENDKEENVPSYTRRRRRISDD
ncbi:nose resistant to fluoxetine protein 6-like [Rhagoletis pomonella]|uniref:nose resistant to fluoxetine protein 6-like n=1 Tax=Rhagoletis pomonella TaxID=28610 RepID=UPI0017827793|nr:nose resistant to fluoxetine protein 6-like [Rhagoletis pomonella]